MSADGHGPAAAPEVARTALITGAARRIGHRIAQELAARGYRLHLHAHTNGDRLETFAEDLRERHGVEATTHLADLSDAKAVKRLIDRLGADAHPPALIVNNASEFLGTYPHDAFSDLELLVRTLTVNTAAPIALAGLAARAEGGHVINITDAHVDLTCASHLPYDVAKAALADATKRLAVLLAPATRVNAVAPALVLPPPGSTEEDLLQLASRAPLLRIAGLDDIVAAVRFLIDTPAVTGHSLMIDSGCHLVWDSESDLRPSPATRT